MTARALHRRSVFTRSPRQPTIEYILREDIYNGAYDKFDEIFESFDKVLFVGQVGDHQDIDSLEFKGAWRVKHEFNETWALGIEGYSEIEDLSHAGTFDQQKHRLGPVAYLELGDAMPKWEFAAGALFGVSDATSDVTLKFDIEAEF